MRPSWLMIVGLGVLVVAIIGCNGKQAPVAVEHEEGTVMAEKVVKTDAEWKKQLSPEAYHILREKGTEAPFSGKYWNAKETGTYRCAACGQELFASQSKFDSGCGWPSFYEAVKDGKVTTAEDNSLGMRRTEVLCSRCHSHLGHLFNDGPDPTGLPTGQAGLRYCINSGALDFEPKKED